MRADRLVAIVLLLQAHGQLTAGQLSEHLETSERTVRRDLDALLLAGVPLYSQRGRGGGWALLGGHRLNLTGFTAGEARALFLLVGARRGSGGTDAGLRSALRKIMVALPEPLREQAEAATRSTVVDPAGWGREPGGDPPFLDRLRDAVLARVQVDLGYAKPGSEPGTRRVHPYGLVLKRGVWYLLAGTDRGRRTFRVSRVTSVAAADEPAVVPEGFDLDAEWGAAEADFAARLRVVDVVVDVAETAVLGLSAVFRGWAGLDEVAGTPPDGGWRRFRVSVPHHQAAVASLAPFGAAVRVVEPASVRADLARIGQELVAANRRVPAPDGRPLLEAPDGYAGGATTGAPPSPPAGTG
ncbi:MAG: helix-turn-helix transcriptional regulator, partial [Acidimicrobiales bacterium]